ncbi:MAG: FAD-dependent oxidoreductase [Thermoplasmatales archaeon]|jgi:hypothetical protein|nr:FAD-dependent oxidoreductase [Thermoplasmatales archaeon]
MKLYGNYDVIVCGAGISGVIASVSAAKEGAKILLVDKGNIIGGMITGGRMTKPTGEVKFGIFREILDRAAHEGGSVIGSYSSYWGTYTGIFDSETVYRIIISFIQESNIEVLLNSQITDVLMEEHEIKGILIAGNNQSELIISKVIVDSTGDGNVSALAGADYSVGRSSDHLTQPISSYFRLLNVNFPKLAKYCKEHPKDIRELVLPDNDINKNESYQMNFFMSGLEDRINEAKRDGFNWNVPRNHITMKAGLLVGEINVNATRFLGNGLDNKVISKAEIELRKQAYTVFDFLRKYVPGFEKAIFLEVASKIGIRETRRITGDYVLTKKDIMEGKKFEDAIGLTNSPIDIHDPNGVEARMIAVRPYGIPFRCLLPKNIENLITAGRCISSDEEAFASVRNTPVCAITGEAAGVAAALSAKYGVVPRRLPVEKIQHILLDRGFELGNK